MLLFLPHPTQCQVWKTFPYDWDWRRIWKSSLYHLPSPLEWLTSSTWTGGLGVWSTPRYFHIPFFRSHPTFLSYLSFFWANFPKECAIVDMVYPVQQNKTGMTVEFVVVWSFDLSMLSESYLGMRSDTISLSYYASAVKSFNFWSKVGLFCASFFLHAPLESALVSLEVVVFEPSVNSWFFFLLSSMSSSRASRKTFPSVLFYY